MSGSSKERSLKLFSVIYFNLEHRYAVIPSNWLESNKEVCLWPGPKTKNPSKLVKDPNSKPDRTFKKFSIRLIKSYGTKCLIS